ncbi:hypothetical protein Tco_1004403 [Tanacetum coccineum]|uniref:Uncharacterized protein n=1 Tax=Tanacetum coccineum TaxID=301880 RepID=A0ABQ5FD63_9ASTR
MAKIRNLDAVRSNIIEGVKECWSVGRTVADSSTARLKRATTYVFRWFDLSLLSRSSTRTASIRKSDTSVLEDLKALSWKTSQDGSLLNLSDHSKYEHVGPKFSEWRIEEKITKAQMHKCKTSEETAKNLLANMSVNLKCPLRRPSKKTHCRVEIDRKTQFHSLTRQKLGLA